MTSATAARERPLIFSAPLVRALLSGAKTMTRRVIKPQPPYGCRYEINGAGDHALCLAGHGAEMLFVPPTPTSKDHRLRCPYGKAGDRLYVKETWQTFERFDDLVDGIRFAANDCFVPIKNSREAADQWVSAHASGKHGDRWRSPLHLPRWASRLTLEIVSVKVERLQDISAHDAYHEGVQDCQERDHDDCFYGTHGRKCAFERLWTSIHGADPVKGWDANPYVWAIEFKVVTP